MKRQRSWLALLVALLGAWGAQASMMRSGDQLAGGGITDATRVLAPASDVSSDAPRLSPTHVPSQLQRKKELCSKDFQGFNNALDLLSVNPKPQVKPSQRNGYPQIFCYVNTISPYHASHAQLIADTWGQRCDKLVFFSNDTGTMTVNHGTEFEASFPIVKMDSPADYDHLWIKHKDVLTYVYEHFRHDYDWF